jgi:helicase
MICHTPDINPKYYPRRREINELESYVNIHSDEFVFPIPNRNEMIEYESFLGEVKCASVLLSWTQEVSEDKIIEKYSVEPGDLFRLIDTAKWLLYASQELGRLFRHRDIVPRITELREMVNKGVKRELLPIVCLEGIGRSRGRMLFKASLRTIDDLKRASLTQLINVPLIGPNVAKTIKEQVGGLIKRNEWEKLKKDKLEQGSLFN